jgi:ABC-type nitrate/sulfonate/bicarbonate transport system ATPase subunit
LEAIKLELRNLSKEFTDPNRTNVLANINMNIHEGEFVSILGPSGSGKSTLFHIIGGLMKPTSGEVWLDGKQINGQKGFVSYMPQQPSLFPWRTIEQNVIMAQEIAGQSKKEALANARTWLVNVGLAGYEKSLPHKLSGGMQQRVSFLRALLSPRELMCLDEPFAALDALTRQDMQQWLLRIWEQNKRSVLFITHNIEEALLLSDRIYIFSKKPTRVLKELKVPFARPRNDQLLHNNEFVELRQHIYEIMKAELREELHYI